jgi:hypothetical protein
MLLQQTAKVKENIEEGESSAMGGQAVESRAPGDTGNKNF